ncbi:unnamed protein product [Laminaria digitata]
MTGDGPNTFDMMRRTFDVFYVSKRSTRYSTNYMPCHASHATPCHAMPCLAMPCHASQYRSWRTFPRLLITPAETLPLSPPRCTETTTAVVVPLWCRYALANNTGIIAATGTTPHTATLGSSHMCQAISQALQRQAALLNRH